MVKIEIDKNNKFLKIGNVVFDRDVLKKLLIPNDNGTDDDLVLEYKTKEKQYHIAIELSGAGRDYFAKHSGEIEVSDYGHCMYITLWVPFKTYYNIIKQGTVDYLLAVFEKSDILK